MKHLLLSLILCLISPFWFAQSASSYAVHVEAKAQQNPLSIELSWNLDGNATSYAVYRKLPSELTFGVPLATLSGGDTMYTDDEIESEKEYEYYVKKSAGGYIGHGYCNAGVGIYLEEDRGAALLLVESGIFDALTDEVNQALADLKADGWRAEIAVVASDTDVVDVKSIITEYYNSVSDMRLVYVLGHVPVPYSGNLYPDAHTNHIGAWPADVYYADMNGTWTDQSVNNVTASDPRNHNTPGDGKFDQSELPSDVELYIGRVDFANLPVFAESEIELTRRYLQRTHEYKMGEWTLEKRALIDDNFGGFNGEAFAANGWRNFSPLVGRDNVGASDYRTTMSSDGYLFSYGCGGGTFTSAGGIGNSTQLSTDSLQTGFTMIFGSYFGDWDRSDNFIRSALAQGRTMSISWAGRPNWFYHPMATGHSIGYSAFLSQNNDNLYWSSYGARFVHIALLGDPSLRMEYVSPATSLEIDTVDTFYVSLTWSASVDAAIDGYNVYRQSTEEPYIRLNEEPITSLSFIDSCVIEEGTHTYLVKATKLIENHSGTYWNEGLGAMGSIEIKTDKYADGIGYFQENFDSNPLTGTFIAHSLNNWVSTIKWEAEGNTLHGNNVLYEPIGAMGTFFTYSSSFQNQCSSLTTIQAIPLSVGNDIRSTSTLLFPNPTISGDQIQIQSDFDSHEIRIFSIEGRLVFSANCGAQFTLPSRVSAGLYMVEIETQEGLKIERLVVK